MKRLAIIGSSDLGQLIAYHAFADKHYNVVGFYDDHKIKDEIVDGIKILGKISDLLNDHAANKFDCIMIAIGYKHMAVRQSVFEQFKDKVPFGSIIHSSAYVDSSAIVREGCFILPGCVLDRNVHLHENVLLNTGCVIAHDSSVEKHSFLSPAVKMAGFSKVGSGCNIGINTTIIDNINICNNVQTGGGSVIISSITEPGLYIGVPAKKHTKL
jgi:sugar O-acyltransferase (sialic acid O-acetyltransferase NeuD family)